MKNILLISIIVISILLILAVIISPAKTSSSANITGAMDQGMNGKKARGFDAAMDRIISILGFAFMIIAVVLANLTS